MLGFVVDDARNYDTRYFSAERVWRKEDFAPPVFAE